MTEEEEDDDDLRNFEARVNKLSCSPCRQACNIRVVKRKIMTMLPTSVRNRRGFCNNKAEGEGEDEGVAAVAVVVACGLLRSFIVRRVASRLRLTLVSDFPGGSSSRLDVFDVVGKEVVVGGMTTMGKCANLVPSSDFVLSEAEILPVVTRRNWDCAVLCSTVDSDFLRARNSSFHSMVQKNSSN